LLYWLQTFGSVAGDSFLSIGVIFTALISFIFTMEAIRQRVLDLARARAWPAPFQMSGQPAGNQVRG
jgi:hypothetical protein